jgi:hypothetical protein
MALTKILILQMATESTENMKAREALMEYSVFFRGFRGQ